MATGSAHVRIGSAVIVVTETGSGYAIHVSLGVQRFGKAPESLQVRHHRATCRSAESLRTLLRVVAEVMPVPGDEGWLDLDTGYWSPQLTFF